MLLGLKEFRSNKHFMEDGFCMIQLYMFGFLQGSISPSQTDDSGKGTEYNCTVDVVGEL